MNTIQLGVQVPGPFIGGSIGRGALTVNNDAGVGPALVLVHSNIVMAVQQPGSGDTSTAAQRGSEWPDTFGSQGIITVNDGSTVAVAGDITTGGGTAFINLNNGGKLDMKPSGDPTAGNVSINILNITNNGIITNYGTLSLTNINLDGASSTTFTVYSGQSIAPAGVGVAGPLVVAGNLTLQGNTLLDVKKIGATLSSDLISSSGTVDLGGTLKVTFSGDNPLAPGDIFTLFAAVPVNSSPTVQLPPPGSGLVWVNKIFVNGTIEVQSCGCGEPTTAPSLTITHAPTSVTVSWPVSYTSFSLFGQTNSLSSNWGPVSGVSGNSVTIPVDPANTDVFFELRQQ